MSLPLYLTPRGGLDDIAAGEVVTITGEEARHAVTVRRTGIGTRIRVADGAGRVVTGAVVAASPRLLQVRAEVVDDIPEPTPRFVLVQALAKGGRDEQAIEAAAELGVDEVVPWRAERSIVQWRGERAARALAKWDAVLVAATKQSRRVRRPTLAAAVTTRGLARRVPTSSATYLLHEEAATPLAGMALPAHGDVLLVVGPEGGIASAELDLLVAAGGVPARLGENVLRSSSAGPAALAVLNAAGRWR